MKSFVLWLAEDANFISKVDSKFALGTDKCNSDKQYMVIPDSEEGKYTVIQLFRGSKTGTTATNAAGVKRNFLPLIDPSSWENKELIKELLT